MSAHSMAIYAERARVLEDPWLASARYDHQRSALPLILADIIEKLELGPSDELLDIGAGVGMLTTPLSRRVARTIAIDHPDCLARLPDDIRKLPGDALALPLPPADKILIYDVVHYLADARSVIALLQKAIEALRVGGRLLIGDLPNEDKRGRFAASGYGAVFEQQWRARGAEHHDGSDALSLPPDTQLVRVDDALVLAMAVKARIQFNCDAYILPQDRALPFGHVREDILIVRH